MRTILQVWFDKPEHPEPDPLAWMPQLEARQLGGEPFWVPDGETRPVYRWAIDFIACNDERFMTFGPYFDRTAAQRALSAIRASAARHGTGVAGFRYHAEQCAPTWLKREVRSSDPAHPVGHRVWEWTRSLYTDG